MRTSLLDKWKKSEKRISPLAPISKAPEGVTIPLSSGQRRLWFLQQLYPDNPFYNVSASLRFTGNLDIDFLHKSLTHIFRSNDILRSSYPTMDDGSPIIQIKNDLPITIEEVDLSHYKGDELESEARVFMSNQGATRFNLSEPPLFKASLLKLDASSHILFLTMHHMVIDLWSMAILKEQLAENYNLLCQGKPLEPRSSKIQYTDYAYWQQERPIDEKQLGYWKEKLSGELPILDLQTDYHRPVTPSFKGRKQTQYLSKELSEKVFNLSKSLEVTPFVLLLSVYYVLLSRHTGQDDVIVGTPLSIRDDKALEGLIGFFIDTAVLRSQINLDDSFSELVKQIRQNVLEAFSNKDIPFDVLVRELKLNRDLSTNPIFQTMFVYNAEPKTISFGNEAQLVEQAEFDPGVSKFDLTLFIAEKQGRLAVTFEYATDIYNEYTIHRFQEHFRLLLEGLTTDPDLKIGQIPMFTEQENDFFLSKPLLSDNPFSSYNGIHELIAECIKASPNAAAVIYEEERMTYAELSRRSATLVPKIMAHTNGENRIVGLAIDRSLEMIVGMLAILNAGCAYLPIDVDYPTDRIDFMLEDANVEVLLTKKALKSMFGNYKGAFIEMDGEPGSEGEGDYPLPSPNRENLAYVIYTSGSTGRPKGVPIKHKNIIDSTAGRLDFYDNNPTVFMLMSSMAFDSSKAGIFWTLCTGGTLVITPKHAEQDIDGLVKTIESKHVSHTLLLPSLYNLLLEFGDSKKLRSLKTVIVAGEACSPALVKKHFETVPNLAFYNEYGPTEATVWCIAHNIVKDDGLKTVPIGRPVANARIYLLNKQRSLVPYGSVGEIYIGGPGLSKGYLNRPDLTERAYYDNPFSEVSGEKLYKTGDIARYNADGNLEFLGRSDQQVKIRGYRIELEEIEKALNTLPEIKETKVLVENHTNGLTYLSAFVSANVEVDSAKLKTDLKAIVPEYMVPASISQVAVFPTLPNGKVDKTALLALKKTEVSKRPDDIQKPRNQMESKLLAIWQEVLQIDTIGVTDNFFELGGDSILSIQIIAKARKVGIQLKANQLFENQTIAELALFAKSDADSTKIASVVGHVALTPIQHWFFEVHTNAPHYWNQIVKVSKIGSVSSSIIAEVTHALISYHDSLRLSFLNSDNRWQAKVLEVGVQKGFYPYDLTNLEDVDAQQVEINEVLRSLQEECDLADGDLFKVLFFDCGKLQQNIVFILAHHLVVDMVSWNSIFGDFSAAIEQKLSGGHIAFKKKTANIRTWSEYLLNKAKAGDIYKEQPFWSAQACNTDDWPKDFVQHETVYLEKTIRSKFGIVSEEQSSMLLTKANQAYNTKVEDLLIATLVDTVCDWGNLKEFCIGLERHGRTLENDEIDISNTIGWFTSFFPVKFKRDGVIDVGNTIKGVKESLRSIPNDGIGFGILKYLSKDEVPLDFSAYNPQLVFNYLGNLGGKYEDSEIQYRFHPEGNRDERSERTYAIEINAYAIEGKIHLNWRYSADVYKEETIAKLVEQYLDNLKILNEHCMSKADVEYTPSDFPEAGLDQDDLDELMKLL